MEDRQVSTAVVWAWLLWGAALLICLVGAVIVLVWGGHVWARAVGLSLFGVEMLVVAAAGIATARLLLRRHAKKVTNTLELQRDMERAGLRQIK